MTLKGLHGINRDATLEKETRKALARSPGLFLYAWTDAHHNKLAYQAS